MFRRVAALLAPNIDAALRSVSACRDPDTLTQIRVGALLIRYLLRSRPWRLMTRHSRADHALRAAFLRAGLEAPRSSHQQEQLMAQADALIGAASLQARALRHKRHTAVAPRRSAWTPLVDADDAAPVTTPPPLWGARDSFGLYCQDHLDLDDLNGAALDLLHAAALGEPNTVAALADLGCLRPVDARSGAGLAASVLRAALSPLASQRLERLQALGLLYADTDSAAEQSHALPAPLIRALNGSGHTDLRLALGPGISRAPQVDTRGLRRFAATLWPHVMVERDTGYLLAGASSDEAITITQWLWPKRQVICLDAEDPRCRQSSGPWMEALAAFQPSVFLLSGPGLTLSQQWLPWLESTRLAWTVHCPESSIDRIAIHFPAATQIDLAPGELALLEMGIRFGQRQERDSLDLRIAWSQLLQDLPTPTRRAQMLARWQDSSPQDRQDLQETLTEAAAARMQGESLRRFIPPACPLVLDPRTQSELDDVSDALRHWATVRRGDAPRGSLPANIVVLFEGERSVAMRRALGGLAEAMGRPFFEIDVTTVLSRFIGEAEKKLAEIFDKAHENGCGLFLDEAQGLLSKRVEAKRAADRYSMMQIHFVAQKLDEFEGIFVLVASSASALDSNIARRALYRVHFRPLEVPERAAFWRALIPPQSPLASDIDWAILAEDFPLDPDQLQRVTLQAAVDAARQEASLGHDHLVHAAQRFRA